MITIHKFVLDRVGGDVALEMPGLAEIISVQAQYGKICVWAKVSTEVPKLKYHFCIRGTGWKLEGNEGAYLGTVQLYDGELVLHVFKNVNFTSPSEEE